MSTNKTIDDVLALNDLKVAMIQKNKKSGTGLAFIRFMYEVQAADDIDLIQWIKDNNLKEKSLDEIIILYKLMRESN